MFNNINFPVVRFYNPLVSCITLGVSLTRMKVIISISKSLKKTNEPPKPGEKIFDHGNALSFSLSPIECVFIDRRLDHCLKNKEEISRTHQNKKMVICGADSKKNQTVLKISVYDGSKGESVSYYLRPEEIILFREYIRNAYRYLPFVASVMNGIVRLSKRNYVHQKPISNEEEDDSTNASEVDDFSEIDSVISSDGTDDYFIEGGGF